MEIGMKSHDFTYAQHGLWIQAFKKGLFKGKYKSINSPLKELADLSPVQVWDFNFYMFDKDNNFYFFPLVITK